MTTIKDILRGTHGPALKRCPTLAAARKALADDLRRLRRIDPELARRVAMKMRRDSPLRSSGSRAA
jgi:hypothetical protein